MTGAEIILRALRYLFSDRSIEIARYLSTHVNLEQRWQEV